MGGIGAALRTFIDSSKETMHSVNARDFMHIAAGSFSATPQGYDNIRVLTRIDHAPALFATRANEEARPPELRVRPAALNRRGP